MVYHKNGMVMILWSAHIYYSIIMYINLYKWEDKVLNICFRGNKHVFHLLKLNFKPHEQVNIRYCLVFDNFHSLFIQSKGWTQKNYWSNKWILCYTIICKCVNF